MKNIIKSLLYTCLVVVLFAGCKKNEFSLKDTTLVENKAGLKINYMSAYKIAYPTQYKVDGARVSSLITYATPFPGGGLNTGGGSSADYLTVDPGSRKISVSLPVSGTNTDSVELASATISVDQNKFYSLYFADTASNTKSYLSEDDTNRPDSGFVRYKFINLIPDVPAGFDLYFGTGSTSTTSVKVAGPIGFLAASNYFTIPINTGSTWSIRPAGAPATVTARSVYTSGSSVTNQRVFTVISRGYTSITSSSDIRRPLISFIYNK